MPFNVASIKDKALSAKNATSERVQNTRDRYSSTPMKNTRFADQGYVPDVRAQPPPPPPPPRIPSRPSFPGRVSSNVNEREHDNDEASGSAPGAPPPVLRGAKPKPAPPPPPMPFRSSLARSSPSNDDGDEDEAPAPSAIRARWQAQAAATSVSAAPTPPPFTVRSRSNLTSAGVAQPTAPAPVRSGPVVDKINWANLSAEDKQAFFEWLDEFFAKFLGGQGKGATKVTAHAGSVAEKVNTNSQRGGWPRKDVTVVEQVEPPKPPPVSATIAIATATPGKGPPPMVKSWSKPKLDTSLSQTNDGDLHMSYPPPTTHGSTALDLAYYISPQTSWSSLPSPPWYASENPVPPPLAASQHRLYKLSMSWRGDTKTVTCGALFADLSAFWCRVTFSISNPDPARGGVSERRAWTTPTPEPLDGETLRACSEAYGAAVADCAEGFAERREVCARGECWDVANDALKAAAALYPSAPPVPSLGRTHGHLIFSGRTLPDGAGGGPGGSGAQAGRWRGGDDRVRRGDVVEWRSVRIGFGAGHPSVGGGAYAILGDPEHTAVITADCVPSISVSDGMSVPPRALGALAVVEQSQGVPCKRAVYDLAQLYEGEVWIYRPVGMELYVGLPGGELSVEPPPGAQEI